MKPASFDYHRPQTLEAALGLLARYGDHAKPIAGGQSLGPMLNMRLARPEHLVDLNDLVELDFIRVSDGVLEIGALTRHQRVATALEVRRVHPLLAAAAATIGHYAIRQRGTLGGSLVHADPAAQLPLIAVLGGAKIVVRGLAGQREIDAADFFRSVMTVDVRDGEMVTSVRFPRLAANSGWAFELFSRRRGDFAIVAVAVTLLLDSDHRLASLEMAFGGVGSVPLRLDVSAVAEAGAIPTEKWIAGVSTFAAQSLSPEDSVSIPAVFRREVAASLMEKALAAALARARGETA
ncbi:MULTISPECIES: FAD binding domain-containing protein [Alphaproteobacteria]|uniref:Carbon monoxide dehydrogenase n=2 Tax=Alphaproteobacteria TaxID=28211 RepID=A0A512HH53_9HYPH|nr:MULTISPECIES: FAD binding domain-containing protein [Alphaproteobacteria]GEO84785.1 carbon monoxide dehydrogenase [Ciceribacter naphthalenivorans]GLR20594.1 carbon monoxide dehydrogenase [Ciceribacter naphthalenivorans]GLT03450.1 carbon monoxide dehydrogenase [Sphingomonas psychrolutea]